MAVVVGRLWTVQLNGETIYQFDAEPKPPSGWAMKGEAKTLEVKDFRVVSVNGVEVKRIEHKG